MRYLLLSFLTLLFIVGIPSCCGEFRLITGVENVYFRIPESSAYLSGGEIETDSLFMLLALDYAYYTDSGFSDGLSSTELYAFSCDFPLVNHITDVIVTSNNTFNGLSPGTVLNAKLAETQLLDDYNGLIEFLWLDKPVEQEHTFQFVLTDNAGNTFSASAEPIIWK